MDFNASDNTADSSFFNTEPLFHSAESSAQASSGTHHSYGPLATFGNHLTDVGTSSTPCLSQTNDTSTHVADRSSGLGPNAFSSSRTAAIIPTQDHYPQHAQNSQPLLAPPDSSCTWLPARTQVTSDTRIFSLPKQLLIDKVSINHHPRKRLKRKRDREQPVNQSGYPISEGGIGPQYPDSQLVTACILYLSCNGYIEPFGVRLAYLSYVFDNTPKDTFRGIFDQIPKARGDPLQYTPNSTRTQPHQLARAACDAWRSWWSRHAAGISMLGQEWPTKEQISWLADLYHEDEDTLRVYFRRTCQLADRCDTTYGTMSNTISVKDAASKLQGKHNCCIKGGEKEVREREQRRSKGRDPNKKYVCIECFQAFKRDSDWKRHERERCVHEAWLCCIGGCQPDKSKWKRERDFREKHVKVKHKTASEADVEQCYAEISSNFRRNCILQECHVVFQNFTESFQHIKGHMESESWDFSHLRRDADRLSISETDKALEDEDSDAESSDDGGSSDSDDGGDDDVCPLSFLAELFIWLCIIQVVFWKDFIFPQCALSSRQKMQCN